MFDSDNLYFDDRINAETQNLFSDVLCEKLKEMDIGDDDEVTVVRIYKSIPDIIFEINVDSTRLNTSKSFIISINLNNFVK